MITWRQITEDCYEAVSGSFMIGWVSKKDDGWAWLSAETDLDGPVRDTLAAAQADAR